MKLFSIVILFIWLFILPATCIADERYITIRLVPGINSSALEYIDLISDADSNEKIYESENVRQKLESVYGKCEPRAGSCVGYVNYVESVLSMLKDKINEQGFAKEDISIPIRPRVKPAKPVFAKPKTNLSWIASENYGIASPALISTLESNRQIIDAQFNKKSTIFPGDEFPLGWTTALVTFQIKDGYECESSKKTIEELAKGYAVDGLCHSHEVVRLPQLSSALVESWCPDQMPNNWPVNEDKLEQALAEYDSGREECLIDPPRKTTVAIIDNGIEKSEYDCNGHSYLECPRLNFWQNSKPSIRNGTLIGINQITRDWPWLESNERDTESREFYSHGTAVAALSSGATLRNNLREKFSKLIDLMIIKVAVKEFSNPSYVSDALDYAMSNHAPIANISMESYTDISQRTLINSSRSYSNDPELLVIAAAGNEGGTVEGQNDNIYPACKGGENSKHILSVAALDYHSQNLSQEDEQLQILDRPEYNSLASFSNFGKDSIDLAAPGVDIRSYRAGGGDACFTGSSFSAPLVSFTAALLYSVGITEPMQIKARILAGTDYNPSFSGQIFSRGELNLEKTLRTVFLDRLDFVNKDRPQVHGHLITKTLRITEQNQTKSVPVKGNMFKIVLLQPSEEGYDCKKKSDSCMRFGYLADKFIYETASVRAPKAVTEQCKDKPNIIEFKPANSDSVECYPLSEIREITLAHFGKQYEDRLLTCNKH